MKELQYEIVIEQEEDPTAGFSVSCPALPGCFSNGATVEQAKKNMREAMGLYIESLVAQGEEIPAPRHSIQVDQLTLMVPA